jgi:transposase
MSLQVVDRSEIPQDTAELGQKLLDEHNAYRLIGERLSDLVKDEDFTDLYSAIGGPALSPVMLSLVLIFQMLEKLPDRLAAEAVRLRIDWKYALRLPLEWPGFHFTNLSHFRQRLLEHEAEFRVFDQLLHKLVEMGLIRRRGRQRTDSTYVLGLVSKLSRLEMVWETLRVALEAVQRQDAVWLERVIPEVFLQAYLVKRSDYKLSDQQVAAALQQAGADGLWLLQQLNDGPAAVRELAPVQTLRAVWEQQFEWDTQGEYIGPRQKLDSHGLIQSPHEPEARYRQKQGKPWQGYTAQVTETAEDKGDPNFITDVGLTDSQLSDVHALPQIQARLSGRGLTPGEQYVDQAYLSGTRLAESVARDIRLMGPISGQPGREGFRLDDFQVDLEAQQALCPAGNQALTSTLYQRSDGTREYQFFFGTQCAHCSLRARCTDAKGGRSITYHEHHEYVVTRRAEMETAAFWQAMKRRPPIEGTISQLVRQGIRQARYRGQRRANLQLILTATAVNLRRLFRVWATEQKPSWATWPHDCTRQRTEKRLKLALVAPSAFSCL